VAKQFAQQLTVVDARKTEDQSVLISTLSVVGQKQHFNPGSWDTRLAQFSHNRTSCLAPSATETRVIVKFARLGHCAQM